MQDVIHFLRNHAYELTQLNSQCPDGPTKARLSKLSTQCMLKAEALEKVLRAKTDTGGE